MDRAVHHHSKKTYRRHYQKVNMLAKMARISNNCDSIRRSLIGLT